MRSEEHTSELQSRFDLVCRLLLELVCKHRDLSSFPTRRSSDLVDNFAYRRLPNLEQLLVSYVEIAHHAVISDNDKKQLKEARQLIKQLAIAVHDDYRLVIRKD